MSRTVYCLNFKKTVESCLTISRAWGKGSCPCLLGLGRIVSRLTLSPSRKIFATELAPPAPVSRVTLHCCTWPSVYPRVSADNMSSVPHQPLTLAVLQRQWLSEPIPAWRPAARIRDGVQAQVMSLEKIHAVLRSILLLSGLLEIRTRAMWVLSPLTSLTACSRMGSMTRRSWTSLPRMDTTMQRSTLSMSTARESKGNGLNYPKDIDWGFQSGKQELPKKISWERLQQPESPSRMHGCQLLERSKMDTSTPPSTSLCISHWL